MIKDNMLEEALQEITLLDYQNIYDDDKRLKIFRTIVEHAQSTDFARITGVKEFNFNGNNFGMYFTKTSINLLDKVIISNAGYGYIEADIHQRDIGIRPAISYSSIEAFVSKTEFRKNGIMVVEFGEYPKDVLDKREQKVLNKLFKQGKLVSTGKEYTTDKVSLRDQESVFQPEKHSEYFYEGKKYV